MLKNVKNLNKEYVAPQLEVLFVEMEEGIAAGSTPVNPTNSAGQVREEWDVDPDDNRTFNW